MAPIRVRELARAGMIGAATGSRSMLGVAALGATAATPWRGAPYTTRAVALASAAELVGDKLPRTPSRLNVPGIASRLVLGGVCGATLAYRAGADDRDISLAGLAAALGAAATTWAGAAWRRAAHQTFGADLPGAVIEDVAAIGLAAGAAGR